MKLLELIQNRYSVRNYLPDEVEKEKLDYVLECARLAPSAANTQSWRFYIVTSDEGRNVVRESYPREWMTAPMYIVVCANAAESWKRADGKSSNDINASIAAEHICLAASEIGLGTCWVCNFNLDLLSKGLTIPADEEAIAIFPLGYIDKEKSKVPVKTRKSIQDIVRWK